ncbi:MAG TPA: uracil-DNA glycosylase family protein [Thermoanaerobaculia bacterium]|nr:uracil-DNA glycosylase family protein [Thermoanaerobaculia bacterium]
MRSADWDPILRRLYGGPRGAANEVANPYRDARPDLDRPGAARARRRNLEAYLEAVGEPRILLIGEALGYRGGRFSGIPFTSERQLAGPRRERLRWSSDAPRLRPTSTRPGLWREPSATVVWRTLSGRATGVLLWNAFPWHPWGAGGPLSNRRPELRLLRRNLDLLERLLGALPAAAPVAIGRTAARALVDLGVAAPRSVRHPAHGGAPAFHRDLKLFLDRREEGGRVVAPLSPLEGEKGPGV